MLSSFCQITEHAQLHRNNLRLLLNQNFMSAQEICIVITFKRNTGIEKVSEAAKHHHS